MYLKALQIINCFALVSSQIDDYFMDFGIPSFQNKDLRQTFLSSRKRNEETATKIKQLDKYLPNNTVYVDDIAHYLINKTNFQWKRVNEIETEFKNIIGMKGLKYIYKRDMFWRTWRKVHYPEKDRIVCYRCENTANFTNCYNGGYWEIEERPPPCPYEFFSVNKEDKICAVHLHQYSDFNNRCATEMAWSELTGVCDNPVVTEWQIQKIYNKKVSERFPTVICGGRESCAILTLYRIATDYISFRIVNETNYVIYSRIMKNNKKNYVCLKDCGKMDPYTKKISKTGSLLVNLFGKSKRENKLIYKNKQGVKYHKGTKKSGLEKYRSAKYFYDKKLVTKYIHPLKLSIVHGDMAYE